MTIFPRTARRHRSSKLLNRDKFLQITLTSNVFRSPPRANQVDERARALSHSNEELSPATGNLPIDSFAYPAEVGRVYVAIKKRGLFRFYPSCGNVPNTTYQFLRKGVVWRWRSSWRSGKFEELEIATTRCQLSALITSRGGRVVQGPCRTSAALETALQGVWQCKFLLRCAQSVARARAITSHQLWRLNTLRAASVVTRICDRWELEGW